MQLLQAVLKVHCSEQVFQQSCKPRFEIERNPFLAKESIQINAILFFLYVQYIDGNLRIYIPPPSLLCKAIASYTSIYNFFLNSNICYNYNTRLTKNQQRKLSFRLWRAFYQVQISQHNKRVGIHNS